MRERPQSQASSDDHAWVNPIGKTARSTAVRERRCRTGDAWRDFLST
jgi:hypothetical protein